MKKRIIVLLSVAMCSMMCLAGCGNSGNGSAGTLNAGNTISDAMSEEIADVTPAPTATPEPTPEPTATPEPTLAPIEWTTEEGTILPTEYIVIVKGSPVKLPCTVEEFTERTGVKIFKSDIREDLIKNRKVYALFDNWELGFYVPDDAESYKDYVIFHILTSESMCGGKECTDITLPGDIHIGSKYNSWEDVETMYGKCDGPFLPLWWNLECDNPGWTYNPEVGCTMEEGYELERGYGLDIDGSGDVTGIDILVSDDKLNELYGN